MTGQMQSLLSRKTVDALRRAAELYDGCKGNCTGQDPHVIMLAGDAHAGLFSIEADPGQKETALRLYGLAKTQADQSSPRRPAIIKSCNAKIAAITGSPAEIFTSAATEVATTPETPPAPLPEKPAVLGSISDQITAAMADGNARQLDKVMFGYFDTLAKLAKCPLTIAEARLIHKAYDRLNLPNHRLMAHRRILELGLAR